MNPGTRLTFECQDAQIEDWNSRPATVAEALQYALTCRTCGGSGEDRSDPRSERHPELYVEICLDCVDGIPRWAVEAVAHSLHQHGNRLDAYGNMGPQTERWQDCAGADAHQGAAVNLLVALRDREETDE